MILLRSTVRPRSTTLPQLSAGNPLLTLATNDQELFLSCVMTVYHVAKRVRPKILTAICYCATRVIGPTVEDDNSLAGFIR